MNVYVIRDNLDRVKIGITNNPKQRFATIKNATGITIIDSYISPNTTKARIIEKYLLDTKYRKIRQNGEWLAGNKIDSVFTEATKIINDWTK
jgi:hypothetical protein